MELKKCPWKRTRLCPSYRALNKLIEFIKIQNKFGDFLEIGAGFSTWYLTQLPFTSYTAVETWKSTVKDIQNCKFKNFTLVSRWEDIPCREYQYIFVDSHVGGDANKRQRHLPLIYALDNCLLKDDAFIIAHDFKKIQKYRSNPIGRGVYKKPWYDLEEKYHLNLIYVSKEFGIYKR